MTRCYREEKSSSHVQNKNLGASLAIIALGKLFSIFLFHLNHKKSSLLVRSMLMCTGAWDLHYNNQLLWCSWCLCGLLVHVSKPFEQDFRCTTTTTFIHACMNIGTACMCMEKVAHRGWFVLLQKFGMSLLEWLHICGFLTWFSAFHVKVSIWLIWCIFFLLGWPCLNVPFLFSIWHLRLYWQSYYGRSLL